MAEFLVETYVARTRAGEEVSSVEDLAEAAEQISAQGRPVRLLASIFLPEDEVFLHLFRAVSRLAVREALTRTGRRCDRVVDAVLATRGPILSVSRPNPLGRVGEGANRSTTTKGSKGQ